MKHLILGLLCLLAERCLAQPTKPINWGLQHFSLHDKKLGPISFYLDTIGIGRKAPLMLDVNGSSGVPLCFYVKHAKSSFLLNTFNAPLLEQAAPQYHYVVLDKPGTPFCDSVQTEETDMGKLLGAYKPSAEYTRRLSLQWRVAATKAVISYLIRQGYADKSRVVAWGYSEGGQVVPKLAVEDKRVTQVVSVVGAGLNQFYDELLRLRLLGDQGRVTPQQAQDSVTRYLAQVRAIYQQPTATDKQYWGHSYQRWASFGREVSLESLSQLTIPIYMLVASGDTNSPIYGLDYAPLEFARLGKTNLTYDVCVGCNHNLSSTTTMPNGQEQRLNHADAYVDKILAWLRQSRPE